MTKKINRYKMMERYMTIALLVDLLLFISFLIAAGNGIIWLKVLLSIFIIALSVGCIGFLYLSKELFRSRSLWMGTAAVAIFVCTLFALILNYPSPKPM